MARNPVEGIRRAASERGLPSQRVTGCGSSCSGDLKRRPDVRSCYQQRHYERCQNQKQHERDHGQQESRRGAAVRRALDLSNRDEAQHAAPNQC